jgi:hypothetical protein
MAKLQSSKATWPEGQTKRSRSTRRGGSVGRPTLLGGLLFPELAAKGQLSKEKPGRLPLELPAVFS